MNSLTSTSSFPHESVHCTFLLLVNPGARLCKSLDVSFFSTAPATKPEQSVCGFLRLLFRCIFFSPWSTASEAVEFLAPLLLESDEVSELHTGSTLGGKVSFPPAEARLKKINGVHLQKTWPFLEANWSWGLISCLTNWYWFQGETLICFSSFLQLGISRERPWLYCEAEKGKNILGLRLIALQLLLIWARDVGPSINRYKTWVAFPCTLGS